MTTKKIIYWAVLVLAAGNFFIWQAILFGGGSNNLELYFLDVGQGDGQLINFPGGTQILIDGGRDTKVLGELAKALPASDRYIDLVILTHPELDHFGGLIDVLKTYGIGTMITNGREGAAEAHRDLLKVVEERKIPVVNLMEGDGIRYGEHRIYVLAPNAKNLAGKDSNNSGLVLLLKSGELKALYTGDIGFGVERELAKKYNLSAQVLKVGHHGSKYASSPEFLKNVSPKISVIGVGKNKYGHPTKETLNRLADIGSKIFRTDLNGTIKMIFDGSNLRIYD